MPELSKKDVASLITKHDTLMSELGQWRSVWQELADYITPNKAGVIYEITPGAKTTELLFDSTAINANELLAASMQGSLTSQITRWFSLLTRHELLNQNVEVIQWMEEVSKLIHDRLKQSNFRTEIAEAYLDIGAFGTGAMLQEERTEKDNTDFLFTAIPIGTYAIDEDADGIVDTLHREFKKSAHAAIGRWPDTISEKIQKKAKDNKGSETFEFIHAVYPKPYKGKPWTSVYLEKTEKNVLEADGFNEFPFHVPRWSKASGEKYGRGPGFTALPDVKTLNKVKEMSLRLLAKVIDPTTFVSDDSLINSYMLKPASINYIRGNLNESLKFFTPPTNINYEATKTEDLKSSIREMFFWSQLQLQTGPQMTATEVERRYELMNRVLGPTLGRLESELLSPLIIRSFQILKRNKMLPPKPAVLEAFLEKQNIDLDIRYEGPLARAAKSSDLVALTRFMELIGSLAQINPQVLDKVDFDESVEITRQTTGVTPNILRTDEEVGEIREARQKQQEMQQQVQLAAQAAESAGKAAPALKLLQGQESEGGEQSAAATGA